MMARSQEGSIYLVLLITIALLSAAFAASTEVYSATVRSDRIKERHWQGGQYRDAIARYYESSGSIRTYPKSLNDLLDDRRSAYLRRHLRELYGSGNSTTWTPIFDNEGGITGVFSSEAPDERYVFTPIAR